MIMPTITTTTTTQSSKKLRRLPHVFGKVLELPFKSDADVSIEEHLCFFRFMVDANMSFDCSEELRAHTIELHPGVMKVVIRGGRNSSIDKSTGLLRIDELELDAWRFRLPSFARAEAAKAVFNGGKLVVTVPKSW